MKYTTTGPYKPQRMTQKLLILESLKNGAVLSQMDVYQEPYR